MIEIESQVCADILKRQQLGIAKYGVTVAQNPLELKAWLQHAYEETLDTAVYLRRAISEIEKSQNPIMPIKSEDSDDPRETSGEGWMLWCLEAEAERDEIQIKIAKIFQSFGGK